MISPLASVVIPAYNQAEFLGEAIHSVLDQTYENLELIVVNDASQDNTSDVVKQFDDPRVKLLVHEDNRGLPATRNTGIWASSGELIALLDSDDIFHPDKLRAHIDFLVSHPEVGVSYNGRFELNYSAETIREMVRPPLIVSLSDFVLGYPFTPSDMVIRRDWAFTVNLFDESCVNGGEDLDLPARLALSGCKFASVDRTLNYRRHQSGRKRKNLAARLDEALKVLDGVFSDPRCPMEVIALRDLAYSNNFLVYAVYALAYGEVISGQTYVREAVRLNPFLLSGHPSGLVRSFVMASIADDKVDHEQYLKRVFACLPATMAISAEQIDGATAYGFLLRAVRAIMWNRPEQGRVYIAEAANRGAEVDETFLKRLALDLRNYDHEFGFEAAEEVIGNLTPLLKQIGGPLVIRQFNAQYSINRAFESYRSGRYAEVPGAVLKAWANDFKHITNRGVLAILLRSTGNRFMSREG